MTADDPTDDRGIRDSSAPRPSQNSLYEISALTSAAADNADDADDLAQPNAKQGEICAQCGAGSPEDPPTVKVKKGRLDVWVHDGPCRRFWIEDHR